MTVLVKSKFIIVALLISSAFCWAEKAGKGTLHKYSEDPNWSCESEKQVKILESSERVAGTVAPLCVYDVKCQKVKGVAENSVKVKVMCKLKGDQCSDLSDCANEFPDYDKSELSWAEVSKTGIEPSRESKDKFGENCEYFDAKPSVIFRQLLKNPKSWDVICATPVKNCKMPETLKGSFLATCPYKTVPGATGMDSLSCPAPQECLATAIPSKPALTVSEAKALTSNATRPNGSAAPIVIANSTGGSSSSSGAPGKKDPGKDSDDHR